MFPKRIRIVGDGSRHGTRIFDADSNEDLSRKACSVEFKHDAGSVPIAKVTFVYVGDVEIDMVVTDAGFAKFDLANDVTVDMFAGSEVDMHDEEELPCAKHELAN